MLQACVKGKSLVCVECSKAIIASVEVGLKCDRPDASDVFDL